MDKLRQKAKELLSNNEVQIVVGYEEGTAGKARPAFISSPDQANTLIYDERCIHNLAVYLTQHKLPNNTKIAIVASFPVMKSIITLASEKQLDENFIKVIGISKDNNLIEFKDFADIERYINQQDLSFTPEEQALIDKIDAMSMEERWEYWQNEFSRCFKCYACRSACPMCYCTLCITDFNQPQWVSVPSHKLGNFEWHINRAMHLAGRCIGCDECSRACPLDLPINLLTKKLSMDIQKQFGYSAGQSLTEPYALSTYKPDDKETFIR